MYMYICVYVYIYIYKCFYIYNSIPGGHAPAPQVRPMSQPGGFPNAQVPGSLYQVPGTKYIIKC